MSHSFKGDAIGISSRTLTAFFDFVLRIAKPSSCKKNHKNYNNGHLTADLGLIMLKFWKF